MNKHLLSEDRPDLTPMIDVVFLLLIYFMVSMQLVKEEADLGIQLPGPPPEDVQEKPPNDHYIDIQPDGQVLFNGAPIDAPNDPDMPQLTNRLVSLRAADQRMDVETIITISPDPEALHQRSIDVLNAAAIAEISAITFGAPPES
ncbi:MAG: ExbD/TolR family protein [Verrucomicrobiota bacterium]